MSTPTPSQSFLGGVGLSLSIHSLLVLNGSVFGVSGFMHRAVRGQMEPFASVIGLLLGGLVVGAVEKKVLAPAVQIVDHLPRVVIAGLLVGIGSKLGNGCTSGHMMAGLSQLSIRSLVATLTFFTTGVLTTRALFGDSLSPVRSSDWSIEYLAKVLLAVQVVPLTIAALLYMFAPSPGPSSTDESKPIRSHRYLRLLTCISTSFNAAVALHLSGLTDPTAVTSFLLLPFDKSFNPSLLYLAIGGLPLTTLLYQFGRGENKPILGGVWSVPKDGDVDWRLLAGAAIFGVGWGVEGICPGPGLINLGRALSVGAGLTRAAAWVGSVGVGGLLV